MQLGNKMQAAIYLRDFILHSCLIYRDLNAPVLSLNVHIKLAGVFMVSSISL